MKDQCKLAAMDLFSGSFSTPLERRSSIFLSWRNWFSIVLAIVILSFGIWSLPSAVRPPITALSIPDGTNLLLANDRCNDPLPEGAATRLGTLRFRHPGLHVLLWSPDGKMLATAAFDFSNNPIRLWDTTTGKEICRLGDSATALAWSPNGRIIASGWYDENRSIQLLDVATGKEIRELRGPYGVASLGWSPDGKVLAAGGGDGFFGTDKFMLLDPLTGKELYKLVAQKDDDSVTSLAWSPDGKTLALGNRDKSIYLQEAATGKEIRRLSGHESCVDPVVWSPDGKRIGSGARSDKTLQLWDAETGGGLRRIINEFKVYRYGLFWSPDGTVIGVGQDGQTATHLLDPITGTEIRRTDAVGPGPWSPDGKFMASTYGSSIRIWEPATGKKALAFEGHGDSVDVVHWSPDGKAIISGSWDGSIRFWDPITGRERSVLEGRRYGVHDVALAPDGWAIASDDRRDKTLLLWDAKTGKELRRIVTYQDDVSSVAWSADGKLLASAGRGSLIRIWDASTGQEIRQILSEIKYSPSMVWSSRCTTLAVMAPGWSADSDECKLVRLYDGPTGKEHCKLVHTENVTAIAWSPDGKNLASAGRGRTIHIWDPETGKETLQFAVPDEKTWSLAWSPDGRMLATASGPTIRVWEVATGRERRQFSGHADLVTCLAWSPDGTKLVSGSSDTTLLVWNVH